MWKAFKIKHIINEDCFLRVGNNSRLYDLKNFDNFEKIIFKLLKKYNECTLFTSSNYKMKIKCWKTQDMGDFLLWYDIKAEKIEGDCRQQLYDVFEDIQTTSLDTNEKITYIHFNPNNSYNKHFKECKKKGNN